MNLSKIRRIFLIGYVAAMLVKAFSFIKNNPTIKSFSCVVINFLQIGFISLTILFIFFRQFFLHALLNNYGDIYSAYDESLFVKISYLYLIIDNGNNNNF